MPGGATRITTKYADGRIKSVAGTAGVHEAYEYGVNSDGSQWTKKYTGPDGVSSPMWEKTTTDLLSRTVQTEKPGFGGAVLTTKNTYDSKGNLRSSASICGSTINTVQLMKYDDLGNVIRSGVDIDQDGVLTLASMDRITDSVQQYVKENGDWFNQRLQIIYPQDNGSIALTNSISKTRLTGLGSPTSDLGLLTSEAVAIDRFGNETVQRRFMDRDAKTSVQIVDSSTSTQDVVQITINGLLQSATSAQSAVTLYSYDALERRIETSSESTDTRHSPPVIRRIATVSHYNDKNQIDYTEDAASNKTWFAYDPDTGLKVAVTNALGQTTLYQYNDRGDITVVGGSSQYPVEYGYDDFGRMTDLYTRRERGHVSTFEGEGSRLNIQH